ncbi:hypothetical protein JOS77_24500 [Chromobacterium haemolyticum]|nr:hypothetical protein JOS77_24500 [Chromobacterium haemolyticum]
MNSPAADSLAHMRQELAGKRQALTEQYRQQRNPQEYLKRHSQTVVTPPCRRCGRNPVWTAPPA